MALGVLGSAVWVVIERCGVARFVACLGVVDRGWAYDASALSILVGSRCSRMTSVAAVAKAAKMVMFVRASVHEIACVARSCAMLEVIAAME